MFRARPPLEYIPPPEGVAFKNYQRRGYDPLIDSNTHAIERFEDHDQPKPKSKQETLAELRKQKAISHYQIQRKAIKQYKPEADKNIKGDPKKTIFVGRLNYKTDERRLEEHFSMYGNIRRIRLVRDIHSNKSKGYAFIEFSESRQAEIAYSRAHNKRIDDRQILVDMEQARVDKYWLPMRLGGGKGGDTRKASKEHQEWLRALRKEIKLQEKEGNNKAS